MRVRKIERGSAKQILRAIPRAMREAGTETVGLWHQQMMPGHFQQSAYQKYGYQKRSLTYEIRKARSERHRRPLVFSGESEQDARQQVRLTARLIRREQVVRSAAVMNLPKYFYQYNKVLGTPNKADELTRTTADEESTLEAHFAGGLERRINGKLMPRRISAIT